MRLSAGKGDSLDNRSGEVPARLADIINPIPSRVCYTNLGYNRPRQESVFGLPAVHINVHAQFESTAVTACLPLQPIPAQHFSLPWAAAIVDYSQRPSNHYPDFPPAPCFESRLLASYALLHI